MKNLLFILLLISNLAFAKQDSTKKTSKIHQWMVKHDFTISGGYFRATYKKEQIRVVQPGYQRDVRFFDVRAEDLSYFENIKNFQITATQHTLRANANFKWNTQIGLHVNHLNYGALTNEAYRMQGTWDGERVNDTVRMSNYVKALFHTNGLNLWSITAKKRIPLYTKSRFFNADLNLGINVGATITSSEIELKDTLPNKFLLSIPGNRIAGYHFGASSSFDFVFFKHLVIQPFWDWSFVQVNNAPFDGGHVEQRIFTNYYGLCFGYRF